jgi:hypothetical protein
MGLGGTDGMHELVSDDSGQSAGDEGSLAGTLWPRHTAAISQAAQDVGREDIDGVSGDFVTKDYAHGIGGECKSGRAARHKNDPHPNGIGCPMGGITGLYPIHPDVDFLEDLSDFLRGGFSTPGKKFLSIVPAGVENQIGLFGDVGGCRLSSRDEDEGERRYGGEAETNPRPSFIGRCGRLHFPPPARAA